MATGPEHYREAEDWLTVADNAVSKSSPHVAMAAAMAQAHATLALAAATALNDADGGTSPDDYRAWRRVASVELAAERTTLAEQLRARGAEQAAQDAEDDAFHAQRRADEAEANGEHVDYAEAENVRQIEDEMALDAAGVDSWEEL